jgi:hypothetical protein
MKLNAKNGFTLLFLCVLPFKFELTPDDSTETKIQLVGGAGQYAVIRRGCEGNVLEKHEIPFSEIGASFDHKFASQTRLGIRGSYVFDKRKNGEQDYNPRGDGEPSTRFVPKEIIAINPFANLEEKNSALGVGYFWSNRSLFVGQEMGEIEPWISGYLRLGNRRSLYFSSSFLHEVPLYSSDYLKLGLGSGIDPNFDWWLGCGLLGPYDGVGILAKANIRFQKQLYFNVLTRIGGSEGISEGAVSLGLTYEPKGRK